MGEPIPVGKGRGSNAARYGQAGLARHTNAYTEEVGEDGKHTDVIYAINGWVLWAILTNGAGVRCMLALDNQLLVVSGRLLFVVDGSGTVRTVGGIPSDGRVSMVRNRKTPYPQVVIVCDGLWYIYENGTLTQGTDPDLPPPIDVVEIDSYFVFLIADGRWFIAGPNEGTDIDPLDFAEAEASSDGNVVGIVRGRTLIILGTRSAEFWDPNGDPTFPFARTATIDVGCYAAGSIAKLLITKKDQAAVDTVIFAATDHNGSYAGVVALTGYNAVPISTPEVDRLVRDEPDKASISSMGWTEDGIPFYALSGSTFTIVYNGKRGEWDHRKSAGSNRWAGVCHAQFGSLTLFGHHTTNKIYSSRFDLLDEAGEPIIWQAQPPPIHMWPKGFKVDQLWADFITGVGLNTGNDDDDAPELVFDYSKDGGANFGVQRRVPLGGAGQRQTRVKLRLLGRFNHNGMTARFTCSANVTKGLQQIAIDATALKG